MYDTLHFWIDRTLLHGDHFEIAKYLSNINVSKSVKRQSIKGGLDNFKVSISEFGISMHGSLSKFYFGNNIQTLTLEQTIEAIQILSERLHVSLFEAKVSRIDFGKVFITKYAPTTYFKYLGNKRYFERVQRTKHSICYETKKRVLAFYDKTIEAKKNRISIPEQYENKNLLRYELRYISKICTQLNEAVITGETLCKKEFYSKLLQLWKDQFDSIEKIELNHNIDYSNIKTPKDVEEQLFKLLLQEKGIEYIDGIVENLRMNQQFSDPKYYSRISDRLRAKFKISAEVQISFLNELNKHIQTSC